MNKTQSFHKTIRISEQIFDQKFDFSANDVEKKILEKRLSIKSIQSFHVTYTICKNLEFQDAYDLNGNIVAKIEGKTGESNIDEDFAVVLFTKEVNFDSDQLENIDIEILVDNEVDVAEIASQYLSLFIYM